MPRLVAHLDDTLLSAELLAPLQLHALQDLNQRLSLLQLWFLLSQATLDSVVPKKRTNKDHFFKEMLAFNESPSQHSALVHIFCRATSEKPTAALEVHVIIC